MKYIALYCHSNSTQTLYWKNLTTIEAGPKHQRKATTLEFQHQYAGEKSRVPRVQEKH
jgi:hypothetical protein